MPRYRVTLTRRSVKIVEAANPYQAAIVASEGSEGVEVESVTSAVGRPSVSTSTGKPAKKTAKKRRPLSPEARAKLAQNLVKARAARAAKAKAAKKSTAKRPARKTATKR